MQESGWSIAFRPYGWLWVLLALAAAVLAWYSYRTNVPPVRPRTRAILLALRVAAILLFALAVAGFRFEWHGTRPRPPRIALLIDASESMSFTDRLGPRREAVAAVLGSEAMRRIERAADVVPLGFSRGIGPVDPDTISFRGDASAIGDALLEQRRRMPPPDAIVLISDGANTAGPEPVRAADQIGLPVYALGVGDPRPQPDIRIAGVAAPDVAVAGQPATITVTIENTALAARPVAVRIVSGGTVLATRRVELPAPGQRTDVELAFTHAAPGVLRAVVAVEEVRGEIIGRNNIAPFTTEVLRAKRRIVVLAGAPSADLSFWMRRLHAREDYDVRLWLAPHAVRREAAPIAPEGLAETDLVIWHDLPPNALPERQLAAIVDAVRGGAGFLVIPERYPLPRGLAPILPVEPGRGRYVDQPVQPSLVAEASWHPMFAADEDYPRWSIRWSTLPPLLGVVYDIEPRDDATVLLETGNAPIAIASGAERGRSLVFAGATYWRWDLIPRGLGDDESPGVAFWDAAVRWLATRRAPGRLQLTTAASNYRLGEPVRFSAQAFDERYAPLDGADVRVTIDDGAVAFTATSQGGGRYAGEATGLAPGEHRAVARATFETEEIGKDSVAFSVAVVGLEHDQTRQQQDVLEAVARVSGGGYAPAATADSLLRSIPLAPVEERSERAVGVGTSGWVIWSMVALLSVEWVARRVRGLL